MTTVDLSWKLRAQKAEHAAESSTALVRKLAEALNRTMAMLRNYRTGRLQEGAEDIRLPEWWTEAESLLSEAVMETLDK